MASIILCGFNRREAEAYAMKYIVRAKKDDRKVSFITDSNGNSHLLIGGGCSQYCFKGNTDMLIASDVFEAVRNIDYLSDSGELKIIEEYRQRDESCCEFSKEECYLFLKRLGYKV